MNKYAVSIGTYYTRLTADVVSEVLRYPLIEKLIFPAKLVAMKPRDWDTLSARTTNPEDFDDVMISVDLEAADQWNLSLVPESFADENSMRWSVYFHSKNGMHLGITVNKRLFSTPLLTVLNFHSEHLAARIISYEVLKTMIAQMVPILSGDIVRVFCDGSSEYQRPYFFTGPHDKDISVAIGWMCYFGPKLVEFIGRDRFDSMQTYAEKYELHGGMFVSLQTTPYDAHNEEHRARETQAIAELGLDELAKRKRNR